MDPLNQLQSQSQRTNIIFPAHEVPEVVEFTETESRMLATRAEEGNILFNWARISVLQDEESSVDGWWCADIECH